MIRFDSDVAIVGGGPAGAIAALRLSRLGFQTTVLHTPMLRKRHVAESLTVGALELLRFLGLDSAVQDAVTQPTSLAIVHWAGRTVERDVRGFQIDRRKFDSILMTQAKRSGASIAEPARVQVVRRCAVGNAESGWELNGRGEHSLFKHRTKFLIDASGPRSLLGSPRISLQPRTIAVIGRWRARKMPATIIEAGHDSWTWLAPVRRDETMVATFCDAEKPQAGNYENLPEQYLQSLTSSKFASSVLAGTLLSRPVISYASASRAGDVVGNNWIKVGEAAIAYDPLSSQGLHGAMVSGLQSAAVINTIGRGQNIGMAQRFYSQQVELNCVDHIENTQQLYRDQSAVSPTRFWKSRGPQVVSKPINFCPFDSQQSTRLRLTSEVAMRPTPMLADDVIVVELGLHLGNQRPITRIGGHRVDRLIAFVDGTRTRAELLSLWSTLSSPIIARRLFDHLALYGAIGATT